MPESKGDWYRSAIKELASDRSSSATQAHVSSHNSFPCVCENVQYAYHHVQSARYTSKVASLVCWHCNAKHHQFTASTTSNKPYNNSTNDMCSVCAIL
eukprot:830-Heterococcus_DN1.PRE.2